MSKIFIVNASKALGNSQGKLNDYLTQVATETLVTLGHTVESTRIDDGYDVGKEVEKVVWADALIFQMPTWWMEGSWIMKKYIDDVYSAGFGKIWESDGRTRSDLSKKYGSGGLC